MRNRILTRRDLSTVNLLSNLLKVNLTNAPLSDVILLRSKARTLVQSSLIHEKLSLALEIRSVGKELERKFHSGGLPLDFLACCAHNEEKLIADPRSLRYLIEQQPETFNSDCLVSTNTKTPVTVIGPGTINEGHWATISSESLIVTLGMGWIDVSRTIDYAYLADDAVLNWDIDLLASLSAVARIIIVKSERTAVSLRERLASNSVQIGLMRDPSRLMYNHYGPTMLSYALYDLIERGYRNFCVLGCDLFLRGVYRQADKLNEATALSREAVLGVRIHDPFANFLFLQALYRAGYVFGSPDFIKIMRYQLEEYKSLLELNIG